MNYGYNFKSSKIWQKSELYKFGGKGDPTTYDLEEK